MKLMIRRFVLGALIFIFFALTPAAASASQKQEINFFYSSTCIYCARAAVFLDKIEKNYPSVKINRYEISQNVPLLKEYYQKYKVPYESQGRVPAIFIDDKYFIGFSEKIGEEIENQLGQPKDQENNAKKISLPLIGEIDPKGYALPFLAVVLGFLDGFNVCSLGALMLILAIVIALRSRVKILVFGSVYILTTAIVYGILISFWYQLFSLITPYLRKMEVVVGLIAIAGAIYFFREFLRFYKYGPACEVTPGKKLSGRFSQQFQKLLQKPGKFLPLVSAILLFAAVVTIVEFPCSAAVPLAYAGILTSAKLPALSYLFYIVLFLIFYLLDEMVIFLVAVFSLKLWLNSPKFITWITLLEAIILFLLGSYYLFGIA